ncbi:MAG: tetratricopeptide repeat protein [Bacteroidales bacterium]|nr:tetratricopeptide repeat protein [Bacteroidales bacterium]
MKHISICLFVILGFNLSLFSQNSKTALEKSHELIEKGIELYDKEEYQDALKCFNEVSVCDPNYAWAIFESSLCYGQLGDNETAYKKCKEAYDLDPDDAAVSAYLGNLMDDMGRTPEAIAFFKTIIQKKPYNANLLYNLAVCYLNNDQPIQAEEVLLREIRIRPFHASSHLALAKANFAMGRIAQSYLAYNMAILMSPDVSYLTEFEEAVTGENDTLSKPYNYSYPKEVDHRKWDDLSLLLKSQIVFSEDFKYPGELNYLTTKQSYLLFTKMNYEPADTSLYNQFYVRLFKGIMDKDYFNTLLFYSFKEVNNQQIVDWHKKNSDEFKSFIEYCQNSIVRLRDFNYSLLNEEKENKVLHYNDDGKLNAVGILKQTTPAVKTGEWLIISDNGSISERGTYQNNLVQGDWYLYGPGGSITQHLIFRDGELDGISKTYHANGNLSGVYHRALGTKSGTDKEYTPGGYLVSENTYSDNKLNGKALLYNYKEGFYSETDYKNDKAEGEYFEKWLNGAPKAHGTYKDSLLEGPASTWYPTSVKETDLSFLKGIPSGKKTEFHTNGSKSQEVEFDETGEMTGLKLVFDRSGNLVQKDDSYTKGILTGKQTQFFKDGSISCIQEYRNDTVVRIQSFGKSGQLIYSDSLKDGKITLKFFFPDGTIMSQGLMKRGNMEGSWNYYYPNGKLKASSNYNEGLLSGMQTTWHANGNIEKEYASDSGKLNGEYREYYKSGKLKGKGHLINDKYDGDFYSYYANDSLMSGVFYNNGSLFGRSIYYTPKGKKEYEEFFDEDGTSTKLVLYNYLGKVSGVLDYSVDSVRFNELYPDGSIRRKIALTDNVYHGTQEWYYPNGQLRIRLNYIHGLVNGISNSYDINGSPELEIPYTMNSMNGVLKRFEVGKLFSKETYEAGLNQGTYTEYYNNGKVYRILNFEDDVKQGYSYFYSPDSILMYRLLYQDDMVREISWLDNNNKYVPGFQVDLSTREIVACFPNGKPSARFPFKDGLFHGKVTSYYPNGNINHETSYNMGDYDGAFSNYYVNGKLMESGSYFQESRTGPFVSYYPDGQKHKEGNYLYNNEDGEWNIYNNSGKLTETLLYDNGEIYEIRKN